ncbi:MAG: hypothetical protein R2851_21070 [Caldilineaceae bacterium]
MAATDVVATDAVDAPVTVPLDARSCSGGAPLRAGRRLRPWRCRGAHAPAGHPELVERRNAFTCAYDMGQGRTVAVVSQTPRHYQVTAGFWQSYDPASVRPTAA